MCFLYMDSFRGDVDIESLECSVLVTPGSMQCCGAGASLLLLVPEKTGGSGSKYTFWYLFNVRVEVKQV